MTSSRLTFVVTFLVGVTVGVLAIIAFQNFSSQSELSKPDIAQGNGQQTSNSYGNGSSVTKTDDVDQIQSIFEHINAFDQNTMLHMTLSNLSESELKDLWVQSQNIRRKSHRETVQDAIIRKLTTIDPQEALQKIDDVSKFQTNVLLHSVFSEWSVSHLNDAVTAATELPSRRKQVALQAILESRDDLPESERRTIAQQLDGENTFLRLVSDSKASQSIANPMESWDILLSDDVDDSLQTESLQIVTEAWREQVGFEVLSSIFQADIDDSRVKQQLVRSTAQVDLAGALNYTRGLPEEEQQFLSRFIVIEWANADAKSALDAVATFEPASLASQLADMTAYIWARTKPNEVIENIDLIPEEFRIDTLESVYWNIASKDPLEAIARISAAENYVGNTSTIVQRIVSVWSSRNPDAAVEWVVSQYDQENPLRRQLLEDVLPELASVDPEKAFEIAIAQPVPNEGLGLEHLVIRVITRENNTELALKFLPRVHENSKGYAYTLVAEAMVRDQRPKEALALATELDESQQQFFHHQVFDEWAEAFPKRLLESLDGLALDTHKSQAAFQLIFNNRFEPVLTNEQIDHAKTFLNSDDTARLKRFEEL
ncbi:MAG: hypothetical protein OXH31_08765 [Gammaproteobacteria bacterium]|nr:hypothetical protein [Gammaproteobacteria bacterium]